MKFLIAAFLGAAVIASTPAPESLLALDPIVDEAVRAV